MATVGKIPSMKITPHSSAPIEIDPEANDYSGKSYAEVFAIYKSLSVQTQAFKPGGTAKTLFNNFKGIVEYLNLYNQKAESIERKNKELFSQNKCLELELYSLTERYNTLVNKSYPLDKFDQFSKKLYKAVGMDGPKIASPQDLSKFHDAIYAKFQEQTPEPDLP